MPTILLVNDYCQNEAEIALTHTSSLQHAGATVPAVSWEEWSPNSLAKYDCGAIIGSFEVPSKESTRAGYPHESEAKSRNAPPLSVCFERRPLGHCLGSYGVLTSRPAIRYEVETLSIDHPSFGLPGVFSVSESNHEGVSAPPNSLNLLSVSEATEICALSSLFYCTQFHSGKNRPKRPEGITITTSLLSTG